MTSTNKAKILGAAKALKLLGVKDIASVPVNTGIEQPLSFNQTLLAAIKRIENVVNRVNADYYVSIEGGIIHDIGYLIEGQIAIIVDKQGRASVGFSSLFPLPISFKEKLFSGKTLEEAMYEVTGIKRIGEKYGAIGYLTEGFITRVELSYQAVLTAILPFLNTHLYKELIDINYLKKILKTRLDTQ